MDDIKVAANSFFSGEVRGRENSIPTDDEDSEITFSSDKVRYEMDAEVLLDWYSTITKDKENACLDLTNVNAGVNQCVYKVTSFFLSFRSKIQYLSYLYSLYVYR